MRHHVYFSPGMFGFGKLGSYTYFAHVERELTARFAAAGHELVSHVIEDLPTASIRRRSGPARAGSPSGPRAPPGSPIRAICSDTRPVVSMRAWSHPPPRPRSRP